jgi:hypothetical protein
MAWSVGDFPPLASSGALRSAAKSGVHGLDALRAGYGGLDEVQAPAR